jgi:hypothetical protein
MPFDGTIGRPHPRRNWITGLVGWLRSPVATPKSTPSISVAHEAMIVLDEVAHKLHGGNKWVKGNYHYGGGYCLLASTRIGSLLPKGTTSGYQISTPGDRRCVWGKTLYR